MELREAAERRSILESAISNHVSILCSEFEKNTNLIVSDVTLLKEELEEMGSRPKKVIVGCDVQVNI